MKPFPFYLAPDQMQRGEAAGRRTFAACKSRNARHSRGRPADDAKDLANDIAAAQAELAVALMCAGKWESEFRMHDWDITSLQGKKVDVKYCEWQGNLLVPLNFQRDVFYVLVTGKPPALQIDGFCPGVEVERRGRRFAPRPGGDCWKINRELLIPVKG